MWRVVIADDEPKIREGIKGLLQSFDLEITVCGEAKNGIEALDVVRLKKPDIILVDICMPKLNGLHLIEQIRVADIDCKIIIVTGFHEFAYAKEAITLGVHNYILKPIVEQEMYEAMKGIITEMEREADRKRFMELAHHQIIQNRAYLREVFFHDWIAGNLSEEERHGKMELLSIEMGLSSAILLVSVQNSYGLGRLIGEDSLSENIYQLILKELLEELLSNFKTVYIFSDKYQNVAAVFDSDSETLPALRKIVISRLNQMVNGNCTVMIRQCREESFSDIYEEVLQEVQKELECRPVVNEAKSFLYEHFSETDVDLSVVAKAIGMNPPYLSRLMKQELGMSFKDFLTNLRINKAIALMQELRLSFNEIAGMVGYSNQHYFSTAFKNSMGVSPSEYRKNMSQT